MGSRPSLIFAMSPCYPMSPGWMFYQSLLFFVLKGETNGDDFGISGYSSESNSVEPDFQIEFNPSSVLAFVPVRSCHLQFRGDHGTFSPPIFYENIDRNLWCNWTVVAAPGKHIIIYITGFQTNQTCSENSDEIIFEGVSSSVENSIVYACWNKHTHVFATEASAVSVVLLWHTFSNIGSNRYFDGRYYVFPDPVLRPDTYSRNCSLASKQNVSTSDVIRTPIPDKRPADGSRLYSVLAPSSSSSIPYSPEVPSPQEPPSVMETYQPILTVDPLLIATTHEDNTLHLRRTLAQGLSSIYTTSKSQFPAVTQSSNLGVYEGHRVLPIAGDLEPSQSVKWETMSHTAWPWNNAQSEFLSEEPSLISDRYPELLDETHLGITSRMLETQQFTKDQSSVVLSQSVITALAESINVSTIKATDPQQSTAQTSPYSNRDSLIGLHEPPKFSMAHSVTHQEASYFHKVTVPESLHISKTHFVDPHFVDTDTDFVEPSLLSDSSYSSKIHSPKFGTSQLRVAPTTEWVTVPTFSIAHTVMYQATSHKVNVPESQHLRIMDFVDQHFVTFHATNHPLAQILNTDFLEPSLLSDRLYSSKIHTPKFETSQLSVDPTTKQVTMPHFSSAHTVAYQEISSFNKVNVPESQHLRRMDFIDTHFVTVHATVPSAPSFMHILNTDFIEPSPLRYRSSSKIPTPKFETSQLRVDPTTERVALPHFGTADTVAYQETSRFNKVNVPKSQHLSRTDFIAGPAPSLTHILGTNFLEPSFLSDISYSSKIHSPKFSKTSQLSINPATEQVTVPHFSTAHTVAFLENSHFKKGAASENRHLGRSDFIEPHQDPHFATAHATDPPELSFARILHADFLEPSLVTDMSYSSKIPITKFTETSQLTIDPTTEQVTMPYVSTTQALELSKTLNVSVASSIKLPEIISLSPIRYIEPTLSSVSTVHHIDFMGSDPLNVNTKPTKFAVVSNGDHPEMHHFSTVSTMGPSAFLTTAKSAHLQLTKLTLTVNVKHPNEPVSQYPRQVASSSPTPNPSSSNKSHLQSSSFTESHTLVLHDPVSPLQVSEQPFLPSYESGIHPTFTQTKLLNNEILRKIDTAADVESYPTLLIAPFSPTPSILSSRIRTSVLDLQMVQPTYWTAEEQPLDPSFPQSTIVIPVEHRMLESTVASRPPSEIPTEFTNSKSALQITEKMDKMAARNEYISSKSSETLSLPKIGYKVTRDLVEPTKELDWWTVKDLDATDSISEIFTHPISTPGSYSSYSGELLLVSNIYSKPSDDLEPQGTPFQPYLQSIASSKSNMDITELISEGKEKSTYSYQTHSDLDLHQNAAGRPRDGYLDEEDVTYFFGNQSDLEFPHKPGDSFFAITAEIEHKDVVLRVSEKDLIKSVKEKITERMIYFPNGTNSLILKEIRWNNVHRVTLTFWLQLIKGGKEMQNFLKTQLKAVQSYPFGSSNATLVSFTVEDVNECQLGIQNCHSSALCVNLFGSYSCYCVDGYEDRSPAAPGTLCVSSQPAKIRSLSEHLEILIGAISTVAVLLLLIIIIICIVQQKTRAKANFGLRDPQRRAHGRHLGGRHHGEVSQGLPSPTRHLSSRHGSEHQTAVETSSTLELTKITVEQTAC